MCMMIIKRAILEAFRGTTSDDITTAKAFLTNIEKWFVKNEKAEIGKILTNLILMTLNLEISEDLIVHLVFISLPASWLVLVLYC